MDLAERAEIYEHKMTQDEIQECKQIESIVKKATGYTGGRAMSIGNPISKYSNTDGSDRYLAGGDCYTSFFCISEDDINFHYYLVEVGDRGMFGLRDFDEIFKQFYIKYYEGITMYDAFLYELTRRVCNETDEKFKENFIIYRGLFVTTEYHQENDRYSLHLLHGYGCGMATDDAAYRIEYSKPVFKKIKCPSCNTEWFFNEINISNGETYECSCPKCNMLLKIKKQFESSIL